MKRTALKRHTPLKRSPMRRKPRRKRARHDYEYMAWVATFDYCMFAAEMLEPTPCDGPLQVCHVKVKAGQAGASLKAPDRQVIRGCMKHHDEFDGRAPGFWDGWGRERKWEFVKRTVAWLQVVYASRDVAKAAA